MSDPFESFLEKAKNPLEQSGLSQEAVKSLEQLNDAEALKTAVTGVMRVLSKALHPDKTGEEPQAFYQNLIEANNKIRAYGNQELGILAKDYGSSNTTRTNRKTETIRVDNDFSPKIIDELVHFPLTELGPSFGQRHSLEINPFTAQFSNTSTRLMLSRSGEDEFSVSSYDFIDIDPSRLDENGKLIRDNQEGHEFADIFDIQSIVSSSKMRDLKRGYYRISAGRPQRLPLSVIGAHGFVIVKNGIGKMFSSEGLLLDTSEELPPSLPSTNNQVIYRISASLRRNTEGEPELFEIAARPYMEESEESQTIDMRIIGSADESLRKSIGQDMLRATRDSTVKHVIGDQNSSPSAFPAVSFTRSNTLTSNGFPLSEKYTSKLGEYFSPVIAPERDIVVTDGENIYLFGTVTRIYKDLHK